MRIARIYTFELRFLKGASLPKWKGNIIRGAFGKSLMDLYCTKEKKCKKCSFIFSCPFGYIFETPSKGIVLSNLMDYAKPYVVKPPLEKKEFYEKGEKIKFSIALFGDALKFESHVLHAVSNMKLKSRMKLERVVVENPFREQKEILFEDGEIYNAKTYISKRDLDRKIGKIFVLKFLTPFRILREGSLISEPQFEDIAKFAFRRYSMMMIQYCGEDVKFNIENSVKLLRSKLNNIEFIYNNEKQYFLTGELIFCGKINRELKKALNFCQIAHLGKRASHGHGWYKLVNIGSD